MFKLLKGQQKIAGMEEINFAAEKMKESDIETLVENEPSIIDSDLKIIYRQFRGFDETDERADLVAIDSFANVVIIELKRDESGKDAHWQAIKYASYFFNCSEEDIIKIYSEYKSISMEDARKDLYTYVGAKLEPQEDDEEFKFNQKQRIILVAHNFSKEVLSAVYWLRKVSTFEKEVKVDIKCVSIIPYQDKSTGDIYLVSKTILPIPEIEPISIAKDSRDNIESISKIDDRIETFRREIGYTMKNFKWNIPPGKTYMGFDLARDVWVSFIVRSRKLDIKLEYATRNPNYHPIIEKYFNENKLGTKPIYKQYYLQIESGIRNESWKRIYTVVPLISLDDLKKTEIMEDFKKLLVIFNEKFKDVISNEM